MATLLGIAAAGLVGPAAHADTTGVRINEVESSGGSPGDWVELTNTGTTAVDLTGWVVKDNDSSHAFTIASGVTLAPGAFVALDVDPVYGLGSADSARLYQPGGSTLVDSYTWSSHASTTYGRCADGTGAFTTTTAATKASANACPPPPPAAWPGGSAVANADNSGFFGTNLSGVAYENASVVWAVKNGPGKLYRLVPNGSLWQADTTDGWSAGKTLRYANGSGDPDAEAVVSTPDGVVVATERNNDSSGTSLLKVLRYAATGTATTLNATAEWNLTADLPSAAANSGLEAITWVPDSSLTAAGFRDEHTGALYDPSGYAGHGSGLYFVGLESNGVVYAYALNQAGGAFTRVATIASGQAAVMDLEWDPATGRLWAVCDDTCSGRATTLTVNAQGRFAVTNTYNRPTGMSNYNNEGFAIAPVCVSGAKQVLWSDDSNDSSHALRSGTLSC
ncbi:lamin tail domain-containing protein [Catellatospora tritici]|uniref:lamin tail domain-containing protein n=1 Tax=Catellatospora tritici TaxID=2851566 RepID=UPI001C2D26AA|nr:lamin tail domain-containing protein [Catellatospora tritici]MBV1851228.1 lamin tail domain-containing protein [Catellatospora tritici]